MSQQAAAPELTVALASAGDVRTTRAWSGTPYYMAAALRPHLGRLTEISPVAPNSVRTIDLAARLQSRVTGVKFLPRISWFAARANARVLARALAERPVDIVFAPAGSSLIAALESDVPVAYSSDATVRLMIEYYGEFSDLTVAARRQADEVEAAAIARADILIYPTEWAARSAIEDYGADPGRVHIVAYGANLADLPGPDRALAPRADGPLRLIFVGVDWARKGGAIAIAALEALVARGIDAHLTVVGCIPPDHVPRDRLTVYPFLSKTDPVQARTLSDLYLAADLLLLPTRAECYGVVFCEAAAHGVPSVTTATGGVPDVVREGVTGYCLPEAADGGAYAARIAEIAEDPDRLVALRRSAFDDFTERLSWSIWGARTASLLRQTVGARTPAV